VISILKSCDRELAKLPKETREDLADALARLEAGLTLSMPLSRPMPAIGRSAHELRLKHRSGVFRVIYVLKRSRIYLIHAFRKNTQKTPKRNLELARKRMRETKL